jgi:hypothetical protein
VKTRLRDNAERVENLSIVGETPYVIRTAARLGRVAVSGDVMTAFLTFVKMSSGPAVIVPARR